MLHTAILIALPCFLLAAAICDIRRRSIPNVLTGSMAAVGLIVSLTGQGMSAIVPAALGAVVSFSVGVMMLFARLVGGGDVKFFAAMAIWLGPAASIDAALAMAIAGGLLALFFLRRPAPASGVAQADGPESWVGRLQLDEGRDFDRVPYGVAVAAGGLWVWLSHVGTPGGWS